MRILYVDMDCTRPDHLGCYGYHRNTSPNIDRIARQGMIFRNVYASDTPCLPSRAALFSARFGINNGIVGHAGEGSKLRYPGDGHETNRECLPLVMALRRQAKLWNCTISPFADRHTAWWFLAGFNELIDPGVRYWNSGDYLGLVEVGPREMLVVYDVQSFVENWNAAPFSGVRMVRVRLED